jgi:hypothetical protein
MHHCRKIGEVEAPHRAGDTVRVRQIDGGALHHHLARTDTADAKDRAGIGEIDRESVERGDGGLQPLGHLLEAGIGQHDQPLIGRQPQNRGVA